MSIQVFMSMVFVLSFAALLTSWLVARSRVLRMRRELVPVRARRRTEQSRPVRR